MDIILTKLIRGHGHLRDSRNGKHVLEQEKESLDFLILLEDKKDFAILQEDREKGS